jgi:CBS domain-containing protein
MRLRPLYVTRDTRLVDAVRILLRERVTELAVVDERMRFLGELTAARLLAAVEDPASEEAPAPARAPLRPALIPAGVNPW